MAIGKGDRPTGRRRIGGGKGKSVSTHGQGLGTGPVGKQDAYAGRKVDGNGGNARGGLGSLFGGGGTQSGAGTQSVGGKKSLLPTIIMIVVIVLVAWFVLPKLLGGNGGNAVSSLLGNFLGNSSYSDGTWTGKDNTGKLNSTSSQATKRTVLRGDGSDKVTVMVYMCGTDLESKSGMASADLAEMAASDLGKNVNLLVYTGGCRQWKTKGISNSVHQIYALENKGLRLLKDDAGGKKAMTDPAALSGFIRWCKDNYPANRNILIMWDHGSGSVAGFGYDETRKTGSMTLSSIAKALKDGGVTFDFIGFDACLMASVETALTLAPYSDYLIASEETEPGIGWDHTRWLTELGKDPAIDTPSLGKIIADDFVATCAQKCRGQKTTLSVTDLGELSANVPDELKSFAKSTADAINGKGYAEVSKARGDTREFGAECKLDQLDLVHLSLLLDTKESRALADAILGAVKYNKVGGGVTDAYGLSAYFPYRSANKVNTAVNELDAMGFDDDYTACVKKFASLEVTGQAAGGGSASPFGSLFGGSGSAPSVNVSDLIGSFLGGSSDSLLSSLIGDASAFDSSIPASSLLDAVTGSKLKENLAWEKKDGQYVLAISEAEWKKVADLQLNVFLDDGKGYIDLGLDSIFNFTDDGDLIGEYDNMWVAINKQPVAYYFIESTVEDDVTVIRGRVPVLLNGDRAELLITFRDDDPEISGVRYVYKDGETDTIAKAAELAEGDEIQPICDRYSYDGEYEDTYKLGDSFVYSGEGSLKVSDVTLNPADGTPVAAYMFTDRFAYEHWTEKIPD